MGPVGQDPLSAFNSHNLALSRSLHRPHFQSSPHTFSLHWDKGAFVRQKKVRPSPLAWTKTSPPLEPIQKSPMSLTHLLTSGYQDMCLSPSSNILVCGVTGCGKERKGAEVGSYSLRSNWMREEESGVLVLVLVLTLTLILTQP